MACTSGTNVNLTKAALMPSSIRRIVGSVGVRTVVMVWNKINNIENIFLKLYLCVFTFDSFNCKISFKTPEVSINTP